MKHEEYVRAFCPEVSMERMKSPAVGFRATRPTQQPGWTHVLNVHAGLNNAGWSNSAAKAWRAAALYIMVRGWNAPGKRRAGARVNRGLAIYTRNGIRYEGGVAA